MYCSAAKIAKYSALLFVSLLFSRLSMLLVCRPDSKRAMPEPTPFPVLLPPLYMCVDQFFLFRPY